MLAKTYRTTCLGESGWYKILTLCQPKFKLSISPETAGRALGLSKRIKGYNTCYFVNFEEQLFLKLTFRSKIKQKPNLHTP